MILKPKADYSRLYAVGTNLYSHRAFFYDLRCEFTLTSIKGFRLFFDQKQAHLKKLTSKCLSGDHVHVVALILWAKL